MLGGDRTIGGTIVDAVVLGVRSYGVVVVGISAVGQTLITGAVIVLAGVDDQLQRRVKKSSAERRARAQEDPTAPATSA